MCVATDKGLTRGWSPIISLGVMTCTCYGAAFYAYGILLDPIHKELGWSLTFLGSVFAVAQLISGFGASVAGRLLDRWGGQLVFKIQGAASVVLFTASWTQNAALFAVLMASGLGVMAASGFYHVSTAIAGRVGPSDPGRSIAVLTAIGAFCSPIYLPVGAILINSWGWRAAIQIFAVVAFLGALQASHFAAAGKSDQLSGPSPKALTALRSAMHRPLVRRMLLAYAFAGFSFSTLLVYQVPIMIDQGLALNAAAGIAAIAKQEATIALRVSYLLAAGGSLFILAGNMWLGFAYGALVGAGLGATTPLQAINAQETFDPEDLGLLMGLQQSVFALAGALGPVLAGIAADVSNSQTPTVWMSVLSLFLAAFLLQGNRSETPS